MLLKTLPFVAALFSLGVATGPPAGEAYYTFDNGCPILNPSSSLRIGNNLGSPLLLQDINLLELITHYAHERIPERVVHAKGAGAYGDFEVTHDITKYTDAAFLSKVGKKTPLFARLSSVAGEAGSADAVRDGRGFAFKLYTEEGNLDWLAFSFPVFFIRDPAKFPSLVHAQKRNPRSNLGDRTAFWDFFSHNPEGFNALMYLFSDMATPVSYRFADAFLINTYKFTKADGSFSYVKIHLKTNQGVRNNTAAAAQALNGQDPDAFTADLFESIENGKYPSWTVSAQIISPSAAQKLGNDIFDPTKLISEIDFPLMPFGKITLNRNPENFFTEVEQSAFRVTAIVPGWNVSPDPRKFPEFSFLIFLRLTGVFSVLQIRLFAYGDTQRYRLGINHAQLPVNQPLYGYNPTKRNGANNIMNYGAQPAYIPSEQPLAAKIIAPPHGIDMSAREQYAGSVTNFQSQLTDADFIQPRAQWLALGKLGSSQQKHFVSNVAGHLSGAVEDVRVKAYAIFRRIDAQLGDLVQDATEMEAMSMGHVNGTISRRHWRRN